MDKYKRRTPMNVNNLMTGIEHAKPNSYQIHSTSFQAKQWGLS